MVSLVPLLVVFVFLGVLKTKAQVAGLAGLVAAILVAILAFGWVSRRCARQPPCCWRTLRTVAFGAITIPIITVGSLTGIDYQEIGAVVGRQTPLLAAFVPLLSV